MSNVVMHKPNAFEEALQSAFDAGEANAEQRDAFSRFAAARLPHRRIEGWRWSDFNAALRGAPVTAQDDTQEIAPSPFATLEPVEFQIIDGELFATAEELDGVSVEVTAPGDVASDAPHAIADLNAAMSDDVLTLTVAQGVVLARPILIRHIVNGAAPAFGRIALRVEAGAKAGLIETFEGFGAGFYSALTEATVAKGAQLNRYVDHYGDEDAVLHGLASVECAAEATYRQTSLSTGAKLARHETRADLTGEGAVIQIDSAALLADARHADFTTHVTHKAPGCEVRQLHKGVAADRAKVIFQGKFHVERAGQQTDAQMTANALLLSEGAEANHKPELQIYADDVECAHGSTCGALDDDALFYLRQRGLSEEAARALLIEAFAGEAIEQIEDEPVREIFSALVADWLEARS